MRQPWDSDFTLGSTVATDLVRSQFPEAIEHSLQRIGEGFDNVAFLTDRGFVFRFPRRIEALKFLQNEIDYLPRLASQLDLPLPAPRHVGKPDLGYPYPFTGYHHLPGETACRAAFDPGQVAPALGRFLSRLHSLSVPSVAPSDDLRRADLPYRLNKIIATPTPEAERALPLMRKLSEAEPAARRAWLHGDLYPRHVLISAKGHLASILDWGDLHAGDPALDLSIAFTLLAPDEREAFWHAYGEADAATHARAKFRALFYAVILADYGRAVGDDPLVQVSQRTLAFAGL